MLRTILGVGIAFIFSMGAGNASADNTKFWGSFDRTVTACAYTFTDVFSIGNDIARQGDINYLYLPASGTSFSFTFYDSDNDYVIQTIAIEGNALNISETGYWDGVSGEGWRTVLTITVSDDYDFFNAKGTIVDDDPEGCSGALTSTGERIVQPLSFPVLVSVSGTITETSPTFVWNTDPHATWYKLFIWDDKEEKIFAAWYEASEICNSGTCSVSPSLQLVSGSYEWYVKSWNDYGSLWSNGLTFIVDAGDPPPGKVNLIAPTGTGENVGPDFEWEPDLSASWYKLFVQDNDAKKIFAIWYEASEICDNGTCSVSPPLQLVSGSYEWYVKSWNEIGSTWSDGMIFKVNAGDPPPEMITLISPAGNLNTARPMFSWEPDPSASWYKINITAVSTSYEKTQWFEAEDNQQDYDEVSCSAEGCSVQLTVDLPDGTYQWTVLGWNENGSGEYGSPETFTIQTSTLPPEDEFEGHYSGTYSGLFSGTWDATIDNQGNVSGTGSNSGIQGYSFTIGGTVSDNGTIDFYTTSGGTDEHTTFSGTIDEYGIAAGTWTNPYYGASGTFRGAKTN